MATNKSGKGGSGKGGSGKGGNAGKSSAAHAPEPEETADETVEAAGTDANGAQLGTLVAMPLRLIDAESFQNSRTGDFTIGDSSEDGTNQSFSELLQSIELVGQKDPITVRPKPEGVIDNGMPYEVIKGFRRFAAINLLSQRAGTEDSATINVIVKQLDDLQALEENVFENTARDNLTGPDLAWAAFNLQERYKSAGIPVSGNIIAKKLGKNQPYIAKLLKIVTSGPIVARAWQQSKAPLTSDAMKRITELPPEKQEAEYERMNKTLAGNGGSGRAEKPPIETAIKSAERIATQLGNLESQGLITTSINWEANLGHVGVKIADLTVPDIRKVAELAAIAFEKAKQPKTAAAAATEARTASESDETVSAEN